MLKLNQNSIFESLTKILNCVGDVDIPGDFREHYLLLIEVEFLTTLGIQPIYIEIN